MHRPANNPARVKIDDDGQISKALVRPDVGDVAHPDRVRFFNIEPPVERVVDHDPRPPAVSARSAAIADLRPDARKPGKACNTVRAAGLTLIQKIVMQLAVAVDLAAQLPGSVDERRLASIFSGPLAERRLEPS